MQVFLRIWLKRSDRRGGRIELEHMDSTDTPLAVPCLHCGRDRQRRRRSPKQVHKQAGPVGGIRARLAICHRAIPVRAAIDREVAQPTIDGVKRTDLRWRRLRSKRGYIE